MKQRPRHQFFPAMRFLRQRQMANKRQMRLRNWLLLALRVAAIALFAMLLAKPSVDTLGLAYWLRALSLAVLTPLAVVALAYSWLEKKGNLLRVALGVVCLLLTGGLLYNLFQAIATGKDSTIGDAQAPVAAVLVFDTSPRMGLRYENKSRLEDARIVARELMKQIPTDSEIAIADAASATTTFSMDVGTAANMVDSLSVRGSDFPLHELVARGIELVKAREDKRKEVFVFTDLSRVAWQEVEYRQIAQQLSVHKDLALFVIDVGVAVPRNMRLGPLRLSAESLQRGRALRLDVDLHSLNLNEDVSVEVFVEESDPTRPVIVDGKVLLPKPTRRDRTTVTMVADGSVSAQLTVNGLESGIHHGQVQVNTEDGLVVDNTCYFTVEVQPPQTVLIATSDGAKHGYLEFVLSPYEARQRGEAWFDCQVRPAMDLPELTLTDYAVVALLDPTPLLANHWRVLHDYVDHGGALAMFLGRNAILGATVGDFNAAASSLLPGPLDLPWRAGAGDFFFISPREASHPMLANLRGRESVIPWDDSPVFRHWSFGELRPGANVITRFSNDEAALVESVVGSGRVITMTTPISDARNDRERPAWNHLPTVEQPLPFFMLMREMFVYLSQQNARRWNYTAGQVVTLPVAVETTSEQTWQLFTPNGDWQNTRSRDGNIVVPSTEDPGTYRLKPDDLGFSVNLNESATDLRRLKPADLDDILGKDNYTLARGTTEVDRGVGRVRAGRELYPFLLLLIVGVVAMEYLMSNRFYGVKSTA